MNFNSKNFQNFSSPSVRFSYKILSNHWRKFSNWRFLFTAKVHPATQSHSRHFGALRILPDARNHRQFASVPTRPTTRQLLADWLRQNRHTSRRHQNHPQEELGGGKSRGRLLDWPQQYHRPVCGGCERDGQARLRSEFIGVERMKAKVEDCFKEKVFCWNSLHSQLSFVPRHCAISPAHRGRFFFFRLH